MDSAEFQNAVLMYYLNYHLQMSQHGIWFNAPSYHTKVTAVFDAFSCWLAWQNLYNFGYNLAVCVTDRTQHHLGTSHKHSVKSLPVCFLLQIASNKLL